MKIYLPISTNLYTHMVGVGVVGNVFMIPIDFYGGFLGVVCVCVSMSIPHCKCSIVHFISVHVNKNGVVFLETFLGFSTGNK